MLKHVYLILGATFIFGFVSGVVLFLHNNTGVEGAGDLSETTPSIVVTGDTYGGCERAHRCVSYRIHDAKTFVYITQDERGETERFEGTVPYSERGALRAQLMETDFASLQTPYEGECQTATDGIAFRYSITRDGEEYSFDSCETLLVGIPLFDTLEGYFASFAETYGE